MAEASSLRSCRAGVDEFASRRISVTDFLPLLPKVLDKSLFKDYYGTMINSQAVQVKVTLPSNLHAIIHKKASQIGLNLSAYLRHLAINDCLDDLPTYPMSQKTEARGLKALADYKAGKTIKVDNVEEFFKNL
jgi:hypothetical protein